MKWDDRGTVAFGILGMVYDVIGGTNGITSKH